MRSHRASFALRMLTFFRVNDPFRMLAIFLLLLLVRLPYWVSGDYLTLPELGWMLLGERLAEGNHLYAGVWDDTAPLSAGVYGLIEWVFDRRQIVYTLLAAWLTTYQALIFNGLLNSRKAYRENTYVPALVYVLLMSISFDFYTLSPVLMALTWVLLAFRNALHKIEGSVRDTQVLRTGVYMGMAALFYLPSLVFVIPAFYAYMLFASLSPRRALLLLYGTLLPFLAVLTYFYLIGAATEFTNQYLLSFAQLPNHHHVSGLSLLMVIAIALIFFVVALSQLVQYRRYTIQQTQLQQVMFVMVITALSSIFLVRALAPFHLLFFVPSFAFFITHHLLIIRRLLWAEIATALLVILLPLSGYLFLFDMFSVNQLAHTDKLMVQTTAYDKAVAGKRVLVLGTDQSIYRYAKPATPYLNWQIASRQFDNINYFENLSSVYAHLTADMPDLIIDEATLMPTLIERIPEIRNTYRNDTGAIYVRQPPK